MYVWYNMSALDDTKLWVVNSVTLQGMEKFVLVLIKVEREDGKRFLMRSAVRLVQARLVLPIWLILDALVINLDEWGMDSGGLVVEDI